MFLDFWGNVNKNLFPPPNNGFSFSLLTSTSYVGVELKYPVLCWHGLGKESEMQMRWTYSFQLIFQRETNNPRSGSFPEEYCSKTISNYKSRVEITNSWSEQPICGQVRAGVGCQLAPLFAPLPIPSLQVHISSTVSNLIQTRSSKLF